MDLSAFFKLLNDTTGVDITPAPIPATPVESQKQLEGKDNISSVSSQRTYDREFKQAKKPASIFLQAQRANVGETLISKANSTL